MIAPRSDDFPAILICPVWSPDNDTDGHRLPVCVQAFRGAVRFSGSQAGHHNRAQPANKRAGGMVQQYIGRTIAIFYRLASNLL